MNIQHPAPHQSSLSNPIFKQTCEFDSAVGLRSRLYAWSRLHGITFMETEYNHMLRLNFGRSSDLTVFLLTWDSAVATPRVL